MLINYGINITNILIYILGITYLIILAMLGFMHEEYMQ